MGYPLDFSGRYYCQTDLRWIGTRNAYGVATENHSTSYGTGLDPSPPADALGHMVRSTDRIRSIHYAMEMNSLITAVTVVLLHRDYAGTVTELWRSATISLTTSIIDAMATITPSSPIQIPADGVLMVAMKPVGVLTATRYIYAAFQVFMEDTAAVVGGDDVSAFETAVIDGRAFTAATTTIDVHSEKYLNVRFENPADSNKNCFFVARKIGCNTPADATPLRYGFILNPEQMAGMYTIPGANRLTGAAISTMSIMAGTSDSRLDTNPSTPSPSQGFLPNAGILLDLDEDRAGFARIVPPGNSFGIFIDGRGYQDGQDAARVVLTWYEEELA